MAKNKFTCPKWLEGEAKEEWKRIIKELGENSDLKTVDLKALEGYVQSYSKWKQCEIILKEEGFVMACENGYLQQRPEVAISNKALADMRAFQKELGLTPSSRSRMNKNSGSNDNEGTTDPEMDAMIAK